MLPPRVDALHIVLGPIGAVTKSLVRTTDVYGKNGPLMEEADVTDRGLSLDPGPFGTDPDVNLRRQDSGRGTYYALADPKLSTTTGLVKVTWESQLVSYSDMPQLLQAQHQGVTFLEEKKYSYSEIATDLNISKNSVVYVQNSRTRDPQQNSHCLEDQDQLKGGPTPSGHEEISVQDNRRLNAELHVDPRPESVAPLGSFGAWTSLCLLIFGYISNTVCFLSPMSSPTSFHITFNLSPKDILMLTLASVTALIPGAGMYLVFGRRSARWTVILASTVSFAGILVQCLMTINTMASLYISQVLFGFSHAIFQLLLSYRACSLLPGLGEKEVLVILTLVDALVYVVGFLAVPLLVWGMEWTHMQIFLALLLAASAVLVTCMYPGEAGDLCGCPKSNTVVIASRLLVRGRICSGLVLLGLAAGHGGLLGWQFTETILLATYWNFTDSLSVVHGHGVLYCTPVLIALTCLIASVPGMGLSLHPVSSGPSFRKSLLLPLLLLLPFLIGLSVLWGLLCFQPTHEVGASLWCCLLFGSSLGAGTYSCLSRKWGTLLVSPQTSMVLTHMARSLGSLLFVLAVLVQYTQTSYNNWRIICWLLAGFPSVGGVLLLFVFPLSKLDKGTDQLYDKLESDVLQGIGVGPSSRGVHCGPV